MLASLLSGAAPKSINHTDLEKSGLSCANCEQGVKQEVFDLSTGSNEKADHLSETDRPAKVKGAELRGEGSLQVDFAAQAAQCRYADWVVSRLLPVARAWDYLDDPSRHQQP